MTKHETKSETSKSVTPGIPAIGTMPTFFAQSAEAYQQAILDWQKEIATFMADRIQQDMESLQALTEERTVPALFKVQQDWFTTAMRDYTEEGRKLMEIGGRLARTGFKSEQKPGGRVEARPAE